MVVVANYGMFLVIVALFIRETRRVSNYSYWVERSDGLVCTKRRLLVVSEICSFYRS